MAGQEPEGLPRTDFVFRDERQHPHIQRARDILRAHPEVRELFGEEPRSGYWGVALVVAQLALAVRFSELSLLWIILLSYLVGAFIHHALWVLIHEASHDLIATRRAANKLWAIFFNLPQVVPAAISFGKYHRLHHSHQGNYDFDADLASRPLADRVSNSRWRKFLYMLLFGFAQGVIHPGKLKKVKFWDGWTALNWLVQLGFVFVFYQAFGFWALFYLSLSTFFALGLHPLGGRWISEHYLVEGEQETNSYYGPLNRVCFNMGYHNEHHDFTRIPWSRLPELKRRAPEFYEGLFSYRSWSFALWRFIWDRRVTPYDRVERTGFTGERSSFQPDDDGGRD